jgi:lipopolysaccharide/colanic/teichoic acid biosynthesis glycosyltransferase
VTWCIHSADSDLYDSTKRFLDILLATAGLLVGAPILIALGAAVRVTSGSPIIYAGDRLGKGGRVFQMYKFRTMAVGADRGAAVTRDSDPRVTSCGRFLRKWKLDERV